MFTVRSLRTMHDVSTLLRLFRPFQLLLLLVGVAWSLPATAQVSTSDLAITPLPRRVERVAGEPFEVPAAPVVSVSSEGLRPAAEAFMESWWRLTGIRPTLAEEPGAASDFELVLVSGDPEGEGYRLTVETRTGARIEASSVPGLAHGTATLLQLAERGGESSERWRLPAVTVDDAPDHAFRAVMIDIARQPHTVETLEAMVDLLHLYKFRYLHLHLTDDSAFVFPFPEVTDALPKNRTIPLEAWRALVAYAEARGVTIIPELDLPGHSTQLKRSGYLEDPTPDDPLNDRDVAHPVNHARILAIVDAMSEVFSTSPYFHIGGDESGAGESLVPFLAAVNEHLRARRGPGEPKRLLVWEGFRGRPAELPATGDDRIVVLAWESAYNTPWNLLDAGYEVINASWKPLYVVGGGAPRYPHIGGRYWSGREIHAWRPDEFWHWQPGTPVFEDRGPEDDHPDDGIWRTPERSRKQILGGQLLFWEQREHTVLPEAWERVPALSERLWATERSGDPVGYLRRQARVGERVRELVQPVRVELSGSFDPEHSTGRDFLWFHGAVRVDAALSPGLPGEVRMTRDGSLPDSSSERVDGPFDVTSDAVLVARRFVDGRPIGAPTRVALDRRPARVRAAWFDVPRRALDHVPDFDDRTRWTPRRVELLPELRGPYRTTDPLGQQLDATFVVPEGRAGTHTFRLQTRDGRAKLFVDGEFLLGPSEPSEVKLAASLELAPGPHALRVLHASGDISPVVLVAVKRPGDERFVEISPLLAEIPRGVEPEVAQPPPGELDLLANDLGELRFRSSAGADLADVCRLDADGVLHVSGRPSGYLETRRWYRDYELDLEWRWPSAEQAGNSGVLVHVTTPLLFYGWPRALEVQLQSGRAGDFWTIGEGVDVLVENASRRRVPRRPGNLHSHRRIARLEDGAERPPGEWNRMRVRCQGNEIVVTINGVEVTRGIDGTETQGGIALQSEGAPIEFRNVVLRPLVHLAR